MNTTRFFRLAVLLLLAGTVVQTIPSGQSKTAKKLTPITKPGRETFTSSSLAEREKRWNCVSFGIGFGIGGINTEKQEPQLTRSLARSPISTVIDQNQEMILTPDLSLSIEKSLMLTKNITGQFDLVLLAPNMQIELGILIPGLHVGYLLSDRSRVSLGCSIITPKSIDLNINMPYGPPFHQSNPILVTDNLRLSPSVSYDHYVSKDCFFRIRLSYYQLKVEVIHLEDSPLSEHSDLMVNEKHRVHWPEISASFNWKF